MTRVIGIDPGTAITGYGVIEETESGELQVVVYGVIRTSAILSHPQKLLQIYRKIKEILILHQPQSSAVEKLYFSRNTKTAMSVSQARGVIIMALAEMGLDVAEITPLQLKQAVVGYGNADKQQVQSMVRMILGLSEVPSPDDAADALALAICKIHGGKFDQMVAKGSPQ